MASGLSTQFLLKGIQPVEVFSGEDDQDPVSWVQMVDELFDATKTDKNDRRRILPMYFGGKVKQWYRSEIHSDDYEEFKQEFIAAHTSPKQKLKLFSKISNRRQGNHESVQSYYYDIITSFTKLNQDLPEEMKVLILLQGLKPSVQQLVMMKEPQTCKEVLKQAKLVEGSDSMTQSFTLMNPLTQPSTMGTTTTINDSIEETTAALRRTTSSQNKYQKEYPTWNNRDYPNYQQQWTPQYQTNDQPRQRFQRETSQYQTNDQPRQRFQQESSQYKTNDQPGQRFQRESSQFKCFNCQGIGHFASQCPSYLN